MTCRLPLVVALCVSVMPRAGRAQPVSSVVRGTWTATSGTRVLQGGWSATIVDATPDAATGTWTLANGARVIAQGTWSAVKDRGRWRGSWSARIAAASRNARDTIRSGTWQADAAGKAATTLAEMLRGAADAQVTGQWRSGGLQGRWALRGEAGRD